MVQTLETAAEVIDAVGGVDAAARLTGRKYTAAWNWKKAGVFPARTYLTFQEALAASGKHAPARLWGMPEAVPSPQESAA